ncbi:receptor like protein kinase S.2-like [Salvia miltiorrhiza]|uniref:receptor like protein kinase S.2-like n=1 Tax=Salvia miltiorrhiza TaxID=226208 RepID=UPI0025AC6400|nr:receptor like protein kinase S.2-like [Salvia miltiorrhiza]
MHLKSLCFVLPTELDEPDHKGVEKPAAAGRGCGGLALDHLRRSLQRFLRSKWAAPCHHDAARRNLFAAFVDAEGVQIQEKVGGENPRIFSYSELYVGTSGFDMNEVLGSGGFGRVYRATLPSDGSMVAVKCLTERGERFEKTFLAELVAVAHLRHRNLVRLRGWCIHEEQLLLVYDYMPNRSLDRVLFKKPENGDAALLSWETRKKIVNGLAAALYYLHEKLETQIIHRDVKASNVMLDSNFNARLGDFGLARWLEHDLSYKPKTPPVVKNRQFRLVESTRIGGTIGYLPPESFQKRSIATAKADVFSFGVVVLEVVSGRRAVDLTYPDDQIILLDWIRRLSDEEMLVQAGDSRLRDRSSKLSEMELLLRLGLMCTFHEPQSRPSMKWVVEVLSGNIYGKLPDLPSFQTHPLYINLTSSSNTSMSNTGMTKSSRTSSSATTTAFYSSDFVTANAETIYVTAESERSSSIPPSKTCANGKCNFPVVETPRVFTYEEIVSATNNFSDSRRVAEVDFGTSYHGFLDGRCHVIVKRLGMKTCPALRMRFANEFKNMGRLRHRNLIQLRGWCTEQGEMLVVYDYSASRLLSHVLFHHDDHKNWQSKLPWRQRYNVIKSLASAVCYLHEEWDEQVIHRNITSSAIILDQDMNPRLGSFALAEFLTRNEQGHHVVIDKKKSVRGIFGYLSPEYVDSGEATTMADVYSFGVVLLEVVTGHMAVDFRQRDVLLVKRVHEFEAQKRPYKDLVDWRLDGEYDDKELMRLVKLGLACTRSDPDRRPSMRQIVSILDGHDHWLVQTRSRKEGREEWRQRNAPSVCLVRRIQALGVQ